MNCHVCTDDFPETYLLVVPRESCEVMICRDCAPKLLATVELPSVGDERPLPCPFCGSAPQCVVDGGSRYYSCSVASCPGRPWCGTCRKLNGTMIGGWNWRAGSAPASS